MQKFYLALLLFVCSNVFAQTTPSAFDLSSGNYSFTSWPANSTAGTYPPNMIFHYTNDPTGGSYNSLANGTENYNCSYNLGSRNRINGQGANGFSFIATSSAQYNNCASGTASSTRFAGAAVLALNSTGKTGITIGWKGRTITAGDGAPVARVCAVKLQYRLGTTGSWTDVPGAGVYVSAAVGNNAAMTGTLPAACNNRADLFVRWVYYQSAANDGGSRPEIAVGEITAGTAVTNNLSFEYSTTTTAQLAPPFISGAVNDPADPAAVTGFVTDVKDNGTGIDATDYSITAASSNTTVVPAANITVTKSNGTAVIKILPAAQGYADITLTLTKGSLTKTLVTSYAASVSSSANSRWPTGIADASAALALDDNYMVVANDETNFLYVYNRNASGLPVKTYDFNQSNVLGLTDGSPGNYKEVDVEAGVKSIANTGRMYWLGSMSNSTSFNDKPNRTRLFAVTATGTGAAVTFADAGHYNNLRSELITWGDAKGYNFTAAAAPGQDPKLINGFNIEGMVFAPDNTTMYIGFRAPLVPTGTRTKAVIAPIQNFETWFNNGSPAGAATIGNPIELNLGGRGIRDIIRLSTGIYIIIAGNYDNTPVTGMLYKWTGLATDAPEALPSFGISSLNAEGIMEIFESGLPSLSKLQIIADNGTTDYYGDGTEAKDLTHDTYKKFSAETFSGSVFGALPVQFEYVNISTQAGNALLKWGMQHADEVNSFDVEYSADGITFSKIAGQFAFANTAAYSYSFINGKNAAGYYRIKANLTNGKTIYSDVRTLGGSNYEWSIYPNPVTNGTFTVTSSKAGIKKAAIFNMQGGIVTQFQFNGLTKQVSIPGVGKGTYIVKIITEDQTVTTLSLLVL